MKKVIIVIIIAIIGVASITIGVIKTIKPNYKYPFVDIRWVDKSNSDDEYLILTKNGGFAYYCSCGNPVDSYDLCDGFTYNKQTKTIKLKCNSKSDSIIREIKILECTNKKLKLKFKNEIRTFENFEYVTQKTEE